MIIVREFTRVGARLRSIDGSAEYHIRDGYSLRVDTHPTVEQVYICCDVRIPASDIMGPCPRSFVLQRVHVCKFICIRM